MAGTLYIVSTPIGNPEDITLRALRTLREVTLIGAEDARITRQLLQHYGIVTEVVTYRTRLNSPSPPAPAKPGEEEMVNFLLDGDGSSSNRILGLLHSGHSVALVCDAGTPTLADPGHRLISAALALGAKLVPVPGANAALTTLVVSDLPTGRFAFDGFPPRGRADRQAFFAGLKAETRTLILYETRPYLRSTLQTLLTVLGAEHRITIAQNLTMPSESFFRGTLSKAIATLLPHPPRGEYVLILAPPYLVPTQSVSDTTSL